MVEKPPSLAPLRDTTTAERTRTRPMLIGVLIAGLVVVAALSMLGLSRPWDDVHCRGSDCMAVDSSNRGSRACPRVRCGAIIKWRSSAGFHPLSDAEAAARVRRVAETRPENVRANQYVPSPGELRLFRAAKDSRGRPALFDNPHLAHVTGHFSGTTDEIIQWAAHKWGIPEDWLRAQYAVESSWRQDAAGDLRTQSSSARARYPGFSCPTEARCYESLGIAQVKWRPDGSQGAGSEPLRWKSTAFNVDYQAATVRFYYDDPKGRRSAWGDSSYRAQRGWLALGGWFQPFPWNNPAQKAYIRKVRATLTDRAWPKPGY
jgi:hypothetical protein